MKRAPAPKPGERIYASAWTYIAPAPSNPRGQQQALARCHCGKERVVVLSQLRIGYTRSCGCTRSGLSPEADRLQRFLSYVDETASGCWEWTGGIHKSGYGIFYGGRGNTTKAHRWGYILHVGPIPDGLHLDHLCRNIRCVNPEHLEPVTPGENSRRSQAGIYARNRSILRLRQETECPQGHAYDDENTRWRTDRALPRRICRACESARRKPPERVTCADCGASLSSASMYRHVRRKHPQAVAA